MNSVPALLQDGDRSRLRLVLAKSKELGFLGPGDIDPQIDRSLALIVAISTGTTTGPECGRAMDLGTGGGLPGLVLALALPGWEWTLLDGSVKRTDAVSDAVSELGLSNRVTVVCARAEEAARSELRASFDLVVARGFAAAAPTAECAAPFLRPDGRLVVTEPPGGAPERWPVEALATLGLEPAARTTEPIAAQVLRLTEPTDQRWPRRNGIPVKRPLW